MSRWRHVRTSLCSRCKRFLVCQHFPFNHGCQIRDDGREWQSSWVEQKIFHCVSSSVEARRVRHEGDAHPHAKECESFLQRARWHMEELDQKCVVAVACISDVEKRWIALKLEEACIPAPPTPPDAERCRGCRCLSPRTRRGLAYPRRNGSASYVRGLLGAPHAKFDPCRVEYLVGGALCRDARCSHERRDRTCFGIEWCLMEITGGFREGEVRRHS